MILILISDYPPSNSEAETPDCSAYPPGVISVLRPVRIKRNLTA